MGLVDFFIHQVFIPLWPFGIVIPIITTIILFYKRITLIKFVPLICTAIWGLVRFMLTFPVSGEITPEAYDLFPLEQLLLFGTMMLILVVLFLSVVSTGITYIILKKLKN